MTCALNEGFFIALYLLSFSSPYLSPSLMQHVPAAAASIRAPPLAWCVQHYCITICVVRERIAIISGLAPCF